MPLTICRLVAPVLTILLLGAMTVAPADGAAAKEKFVRHAGHYWVWFGPKAWAASYGTYGITVTGDRGATLDLGFSSIICSPGATYAKSVTRYYADKRTYLKQQLHWKLTKVSTIAHPSGGSKTYRRQIVSFTTTSGGVTYQGIAAFDYDFQEAVDGVNYCYQRSLAKLSKQTAWKQVQPVLLKVEGSLAYSGPGAPGEEPNDPPGGIGPQH